MIRKVLESDAEAIAGIYNHYIKNTFITFEEEPVNTEFIRDRIKSVTKMYPWFVFEENGVVLGYAYAGRWKERASFRFSVEDSVYVHKDHFGKGIGVELLAALLEALRKIDVHAVVAGITMPNERSIATHEKFGFTKIGQFKEIGYKLNKWHDVGYWELILR